MFFFSNSFANILVSKEYYWSLKVQITQAVLSVHYLGSILYNSSSVFAFSAASSDVRSATMSSKWSVYFSIMVIIVSIMLKSLKTTRNYFNLIATVYSGTCYNKLLYNQIPGVRINTLQCGQSNRNLWNRT